MKAILQFPKLGKFSRGRVRNFPFSAEHGRNIHHGIEYPLNTPAEVAAFNAIAEKVQGDDSQDYRISTRILDDDAAVADAGGISREEAELMVKALDDLRAENAALKAAVQPPTAVADEAAEEPVKEATHHKKKGKAK